MPHPPSPRLPPSARPSAFVRRPATANCKINVPPSLRFPLFFQAVRGIPPQNRQMHIRPLKKLLATVTVFVCKTVNKKWQSKIPSTKPPSVQAGIWRLQPPLQLRQLNA